MSFSAEWLSLREGVDHRARNRDVLAAAAAHLDDVRAGDGTVRIVDLGCGTGSNLRGAAEAFGDSQSWRLVDYDPALLAAARERLSHWSDEVRGDGDDLVLMKGGRRIAVSFLQADLSGGAEEVIADKPHLVTAAALFDLMSPAWIGRFCAGLAARRLAFYTVLTYDGRDAWLPPHPLDDAVNAAFAAHQRRDKGFGPAAGPAAAETLVQTLDYAGYAIVTGDSPWRLGPKDADLTRELIAGIVQAVGETELVDTGELEGWQAARRGAQGEVGHLDIFARPR